MAFDLINYMQETKLISVIALFLLIFAIVYGILLKTKIFKDNKLNGLIAIIVGLIASNINFSSGCLPELFKFLIISLVVILVIYLMIGLFINLEDKKVKHVLSGILVFGIIIFVITSDVCGFGLLSRFEGAWPWLIGFIILAGIIYSIVKEPKKKERKEKIAKKPKEEGSEDQEESEDDGDDVSH